jgi:putative peptidoglycan lipid II flippase
MLGLMFLAQPLVATLFQHGKFTAFDTKMAAMSVFGLSFGLPAFALLKIVLPAFYARQDTRTPVRAGIAALIANMVLNVVFLWVLYMLWTTPEARAQGVMAALELTPGLHLALGFASAAASYLNLAVLWYWLRKAGVYQRQSGWARYLTRLLVACAAMSAALWAGLYWVPEFTTMGKWDRIGYLGVLVGGGGLVYLVTLLVLGFRPRDLREH